MKLIKTGAKRGSFVLLAATHAAQAAMMTLPPGGTSDDEPSNEHPRSEQWLFVISGRGRATIGRRCEALRRIDLRKNSLLLIEKRELHQIENTGRRPLVTLNFYVPPAYDAEGEAK
jgi:mannose-6-phosphate isomerase-like protein (cupin superfamily)